ncbi:MAG: monofunctional biosynthetic peptidoglycan transglycosylase [Microscillaceae bacterium]
MILFGGLLLLILLYKFVPVPFTPTMLFRSLEAWAQGKDARIYYQWVSYENIADPVKVAVVASEDQRFPQHGGLDFAAIRQAMEENKRRLKPRGASTISQQVAKNVFLWQGGGYFRKALEVPITYLIEWIWGKQRILEVYLNVAEMGPQTFGVQAAAKKMLNKNAASLGALEAARIAAVLPNPKNYLIHQPNGIVIYRQNHILYQMQLLGGISYLKNLRKF